MARRARGRRTRRKAAARRMRDNLARGARPLEGYEHYRAFTDMSWIGAEDWFDGFVHFRELEAAYGGQAGGSRFILNTRPLDHWVRSVMAHANRRPHWRHWAAHHLRRFDTEDPERIAEGWRALRAAQHRRVRAALPPVRLLVFDIESDARRTAAGGRAGQQRRKTPPNQQVYRSVALGAGLRNKGYPFSSTWHKM